MATNIAILLGRLTRDIDLQYLNNGTALAKGNIAIDKGLSKEKKEEMEAQGKPTADFINLIFWGKTAEYVAQYTQKGGRIAVNGRIQSGSYKDKDGKTVYTIDINCYNVDIIDYKTDNQETNTQEDSLFEQFENINTENIPF